MRAEEERELDPPRWAALPCILEDHPAGTFGSLEERKGKALGARIDESY